jgi:hypothetical protein
MMEPIRELQRLRKAALQVNVACKRWSATAGASAEVLAHCALVGWRLARVITGWLQSHPNWRLHPSECRLAEFAIRTSAALESLLYLSDRSRLNRLGAQLAYLDRCSADVRAVTSSVAINDMLSRHQPDLKSLRRAVSSLRPRPTAAAAEPVTGAEPYAMSQARPGIFAQPVDADWPYLSF